MSKSISPVGKTMPNAQRRLIEGRKLRFDPEAIMARLWAKENTRHGMHFGRVPLDRILHECNDKCCSDRHCYQKINDRDIRVASATVQWLATNCGQSLLFEFFKKVKEKNEKEYARKIRPKK